MRKNRGERGSVTVYVLTTCMLVLAVLTSVYVRNQSKLASQRKQQRMLEQQYSVDSDKIAEVYNEKLNSRYAVESSMQFNIYTLEELEQFRDSVNKGNSYLGYTINLMNNIDLSEKYGNGKLSWTPIGDSATKSGNCFEGTFNGNNKTISGIYISNSNIIQGLFGVVKNGKISNLTISGDIKAANLVGGLVGRIENATSQIIENCTNNCNVETTTSPTAGGIVGSVAEYSKNVTIRNCTNNGEIETAAGNCRRYYRKYF